MIEYIFKSSLSLIILFGLYWFLLRKEKLFVFNRFFLLFAILFSLVIPFISISVNFQNNEVRNSIVSVLNNSIPEKSSIINSTTANFYQQPSEILHSRFDISQMLKLLYFIGVILLLVRFLRNIFFISRQIGLSEKINYCGQRLALTDHQVNPFCFFNTIFISKHDYLNKKIGKELLTHELEHIKQSHSVDVILVELIQIIYWFNPLLILYNRAVRVNHEYLADNGVIRNYSDINNYADKLISFIGCKRNIPLTTGFNQSLTRKRLLMLTKSKPNKINNVVRIFTTVSFVSVFFLSMSFKNSNTQDITSMTTYEVPEKNKQVVNVVKGFVNNKFGKYLEGVRIIVPGKNMGVSTDAMGHFAISNVTEDDLLVFSFEGYKTQTLKPVFSSAMLVTLIEDSYLNGSFKTGRDTSLTPTASPLIVIDGVVADKVLMTEIDPKKVSSLSVLKDKSATDKYGEKGKNGVIEITSKGKVQESVVKRPPVSSGTGVGAPKDKPLYIVDGVVYTKELNDIPPQDIQSVHVIKDKSATEKYGEKGKYGVIEIVTRKRPIETGKKDSTELTDRKSVSVTIDSTSATQNGVSQELLKEYQDIIIKCKSTLRDGKESYFLNLIQADKERLEKIFFRMSREQQAKQMFVFVPSNSMVLPRIVPTREQLELFKDPKMYGVWIDGERVGNEVLNNYKNTDFAFVVSSKLEKNATNYGKHVYQVNLMTNDNYQEYYNKNILKKGYTLVPNKGR